MGNLVKYEILKGTKQVPGLIPTTQRIPAGAEVAYTVAGDEFEAARQIQGGNFKLQTKTI